MQDFQSQSQSQSQSQLAALKNDEIEISLKGLINKERSLLYIILLHIIEVERRQIFLARGCSSLFDYLVNVCGYSSSAAQRRIEAARLMRNVPELGQKIKDGRMHLSQVGEFARAVKQKQFEAHQDGLGKQGHISIQEQSVLLCKIENKSTVETQKILSHELDLKLAPLQKTRTQKDSSVCVPLTFSQQQYQKLMDCKNGLAHMHRKNGRAGTTIDVIETLMDQYLQKRQGPVKQTARKSVSETSTNDASADANSKSSSSPSSDQKITAAAEVNLKKPTVTSRTKRDVLRRDQCCQFKDPLTGRTCRSRFGLEVDHVQPVWAMGGPEIGNLRVLCAAHNKFRYRQNANLKNT